MPNADSGRQDFLDVARAAAAAMVFFEHTRRDFLPDSLNWSLDTFNIGRSGVILFLIISGYIIPASLQRTPTLARFWVRRAFRLTPTLYFSIALAALCLLVAGPPWKESALSDPWIWLGNLILAPDLFGRNYVWGVMWTLRMELIVYAAASVLAWRGWLHGAPRMAWILPMALVTLGVSRPILGQPPFEPDAQRMTVFLALVGLAAFGQHESRSRRPVAALLIAAILGAGAGVCFLNAICYPGYPWHSGLCRFLTTWGMGLIPFGVLFTLRDAKMPGWACYLGRISYSTYLMHAFVLLVLTGLSGSVLQMPLAALGTLLVASLTYRLVELPGIQLGRRVERWIWPASQNAASPASEKPVQTQAA